MRAFALKDKHGGKIQSASHAKFKPPFAGQSNEVRCSNDLQRPIGNQAVRRLLRDHPEKVEDGSFGIAPPHLAHAPDKMPLHTSAYSNIQPRLEINIPGDRYEQEADGIADEVIAMPEQGLRRATLTGTQGCTTCPAEQAGQLRQLVQRSGNETNDVANAANPFIVPNVLRSPGQPLDAMARSFFEPRFGRNFNQVRVHTDPHAAEVSRALNARAFTVGDDVFFGAGEYRPGNSGGRRLIAHELAHTVQQAHNAVKIQRSNGAPGVSHFSVYNPGDFHWPLLSANRQPEMRAYTAGSIIRGTRYGDYDGWTSVTASFEFEVEEAGARVDVDAGAEVKGLHSSTGAGAYVRDAWVEATAIPGSAFIDAEVGWSRPFRWTRARWDFDVHDAAAIELPIEIRAQYGGKTAVAQRIISFFGNGATEIDFRRTPTIR